jgi:pyrroline-5-carboxylate reductase
MSQLCVTGGRPDARLRRALMGLCERDRVGSTGPATLSLEPRSAGKHAESPYRLHQIRSQASRLSDVATPLDRWPASVGLIGAGAMGRALLSGLAQAHTGLGERALVCDAMSTAARAGADEVGGAVAALPVAAKADLVVVAVKPKDTAAVLEQIASGGDGVVLSVVAGWTLDAIGTRLGSRPYVRTMPNLAVRHLAGVLGVCERNLDAAQHERLDALLRPLGAIIRVDESLFPVVTALAGSGPGLVAVVAEGLEEGAVACGLSRHEARTVVQAVLAGTASLLAGGEDPAVLRQRVSSPGGTTIEGVAVLERGAVRAHLQDAVRAAAARARALAPETPA